MKVHTPIGSKERFLEMFKRVNKLQLNEVVTNVFQTGTQLVEKAFNELKNKQAQVKQTNTQTEGDKNFVEIITNDNDGNEFVFRFRLNSMETGQDDVYNVNDASLVEFKVKSATMNVDLPENMKAVQEFNATHGSEIMDVVSEYANFETDSFDEELEEAIKLIDKIPYKKGTETMQTSKAYANQKPTNPDLRVKSDELDKFVNENLNNILHYSQSARDSGMLYPQAKSMGVTNQYILKDTLSDIGIDIVNIVDIGDKYQITLKYNGQTKSAKLKKNYGSAAKVRDLLKKKLGINEENEYQNDDYTQNNSDNDIMALPPDYSDADLPKDDIDDDGTKGIDPYDMVDIDFDDEVNPEEQELYSQAYDNLIAAGNSTPTSPQIDAEILKIKREKGLAEPFKKTRAIPKEAEPFFEELGRSIVYDINADDAVKHGFEKTLSPEAKEHLIRMADETLSVRLGERKFQIPREDYVRMVKEIAIQIYKTGQIGIFGGLNEEESEYPKEIGKKFKPKRQIPKKKKKPDSVVKLDEDEFQEPDFDTMGMEQDDMELDTQVDDIEQISQEKEEIGDMLSGGLGDSKSPNEFSPEQIKLGIKVEMEHTDDPMIAVEIALDHLMEDPEYYTRKDDPEASAQDGAAKDAEEKPKHPLADILDDDDTAEDLSKTNTGRKGINRAIENNDELTDELLGYKPQNVNDYIGSQDEKEELDEEEGMDEYQGEIGDRYEDANNNQFTVRNKVKGGVTLQGRGGEKEVATSDLQFLKKLSEEKIEQKEVITEEQVKMARQALNKRGLTEGITKKEAVQILIKYNVNKMK